MERKKGIEMAILARAPFTLWNWDSISLKLIVVTKMERKLKTTEVT